ncbi:MAG: DUF4936 family protein [Pseudomonadota bacterium]
MHVYVWYRVERDDAATVTAIRGMMARLACRTGIPGQLLRKAEEPGLWMEVYQGITDPDAFTRLMAEKVDEFDLAMFIDGNRRVEIFQVDWSSNATCGTQI